MSTVDRQVDGSAFWPTPYSAALVQAMQRHPEWVQRARVLEIGCGSGVLLAAAGTLGAESLCGVDIEQTAVAATRRLLQALDPSVAFEVYQGSLFGPVAGRRFELILANLPHYPMDAVAIGDRLPSWSSGGADGRKHVDPFVTGLGAHLTPDGRAIMVHNAFVDIDSTRAIAHRQGLNVEVAATILVDLPPPKLARMTPEVLERETGRSIHFYGPLAFGEMLVLVISRNGLTGGPR